MNRFASFLTIAAAMLSAPALAADKVTLDSQVLVERTVVGDDGQARTTLEDPKLVVPGDKLMIVLSYRNIGTDPVNDFVVTNPVPSAVSYQSSEKTALVSVDDGVTWGKLETLSVKQADGTDRAARPEDVTHIRWAFAQPIPAGQAGKLMFRGIVK